jgi:hypothetical protein
MILTHKSIYNTQELVVWNLMWDIYDVVPYPNTNPSVIPIYDVFRNFLPQNSWRWLLQQCLTKYDYKFRKNK